MNLQMSRTLGIKTVSPSHAIRDPGLPLIGSRYSESEPARIVQIGRTCRKMADWSGRYHVVCHYDDERWYSWEEEAA